MPGWEHDGRAFGQTARQFADEVIEIEVGYDSAGRVRDVLRARPDVGVVSVVHCETPCGTMNDVGAIAAAVAGHDALLLVNAVSSLSLLHVSEAAWQHMAANPRAPGGAALSLPVVQIAHMGPAAYPLGPVIALVALGRALRRVGAAADVAAAVEAALGEDPLCERGSSRNCGDRAAARTESDVSS